jgi:receptor protein-tyrosine kinase
MSKHFELMQQIEKDRMFDSGSSSTGLLTSLERRAKSNGRARWADDEALRLVQQIFLLQTEQPPRIVVFAGIDHGNGCSQMCASVAEILAKNARRPVCLVEANFRSPGLAGLFGTANHEGLTEALLNKGTISSFAKPTSHDNLWLLSAGTLAADSAGLLTSEYLGDRLDELRQEFEFVIIDAPPLTRYSDAIALGQHTDGLVLVIEANATRREAASAVATTLRSMNVPILAAVLNKRTFPIPENIYRRL